MYRVVNLSQVCVFKCMFDHVLCMLLLLGDYLVPFVFCPFRSGKFTKIFSKAISRKLPLSLMLRGEMSLNPYNKSSHICLALIVSTCVIFIYLFLLHIIREQRCSQNKRCYVISETLKPRVKHIVLMFDRQTNSYQGNALGYEWPEGQVCM